MEKKCNKILKKYKVSLASDHSDDVIENNIDRNNNNNNKNITAFNMIQKESKNNNDGEVNKYQCSNHVEENITKLFKSIIINTYKDNKTFTLLYKKDNTSKYFIEGTKTENINNPKEYETHHIALIIYTKNNKIRGIIKIISNTKFVAIEMFYGEIPPS